MSETDKKTRVIGLNLQLIEVTKDSYDALISEFDTFKRDDVKNESIIDLTTFDGDDLKRVAMIMRHDADEIDGFYVVFYHEGRSWDMILEELS